MNMKIGQELLEMFRIVKYKIQQVFDLLAFTKLTISRKLTSQNAMNMKLGQ